MTLQRYNQIILAVAGTLGAVLLLTLSLLVISETVNNLFPDNRRPDDGIIATQEAKKRAERNERFSLISEDSPQLVDTTRAIYLVPVVERRLHSTESIQYERSRIGSLSKSDRLVSSGSGSYVNYVVYNARTGTSTRVLDDRVLSLQYTVLDDDTSLSLFAPIIREDTNENGILDPDDRAEILEYDLRDGTRHLYGDLPRFATFHYDASTQAFFVTAWTASEEDAEDRFADAPPTRVYRVDRDTRTLVPVLPDRTRTLLQSILDGTAESSAGSSADEE